VAAEGPAGNRTSTRFRGAERYSLRSLRSGAQYVLGQPLGTDHDTSAFAVESIRRPWTTMGSGGVPRRPPAFDHSGRAGSNRSRARLWKQELPKLADKTELEISVSHFPPGTSKWNRIAATAVRTGLRGSNPTGHRHVPEKHPCGPAGVGRHPTLFRKWSYTIIMIHLFLTLANTDL
jgi:hypothetical protein